MFISTGRENDLLLNSLESLVTNSDSYLALQSDSYAHKLFFEGVLVSVLALVCCTVCISSCTAIEHV